MSNIGVAVVGAGFIGPVHVEALQRAGLNVVGILGVDDAETSRAAKQLNLYRAYSDYEEILTDPAVNAVHLATPNRLHYEMTKKALNAGKHVMCEKPLAMNSTESAELVELAAKSGLVAGVNYNIRFYPLCLEAADMVHRGDVGELFSVCGSYVQDWLFYDTDYNWRVLAEEGGELRAIADIGTHWLDLIATITHRKVESVCADLSTVYPTRKRPLGEVETFKDATDVKREEVAISTEDYGCLMMRFEGGGRGCLWVSQVTAGRKNCLRYELSGSKCSLSWCSERPNELWIGHRDRPNENLIRDPSLVSDAASSHISYPGGHNEGFADTFKQNFRAFYGYIAAGDFSAKPTFATFAAGHREILLCEAIIQSHRQNRWVDVKGA